MYLSEALANECLGSSRIQLVRWFKVSGPDHLAKDVNRIRTLFETFITRRNPFTY
jgi:hypothetical protein